MTWWSRLLRRDRVEAQLDAELRDHFERLVLDFRREGLSGGEARRRARLEFGGLDQVKEMCRDVRGTRWLEELAQDVRYGLRSFRKTPGFTSVAILTLALGVGANLAIFNLVDALLLRPLPVRDPAGLVTLFRWMEGNSAEHFSYPQVQYLADQSDLFTTLCGIGSDTVHVGPPDALEPTGAAWVSGRYFDTLGLSPVAGRLLTAADDLPGADPVVVITHGYWMRRFNGSASVIGQSLLLEGQQVPIVGITPRGFTGATVGENAEITLAISARPRLQPEDDDWIGPDARWLRVLARPAAPLGHDAIEAQLAVKWAQHLAATTPATMAADRRKRALSLTLTVEPGANGTSTLRARFRTPLFVAMGLVTLVLLIACVNVANLLLARGATRAREIAMRYALGAGRARIVRQLLTESVLLAIVGTSIGVVLAWYGSSALVDLIASTGRSVDSEVIALAVAPNRRILLVTVLLVAGTVLLFGVLPALRASSARPGTTSNGAAARVIESHGRLQSLLVVAQVALSLVVVVGAGLFGRTVQNLRALDRGFRADDVLLVSYDPSRNALARQQLQAFNQSVLESMDRLPGLQSASLAAITPLQGGGMSNSMAINGVSTGLEEVYFNFVAPRYFEIMHTPLLSGREFTDNDDTNAPPVAIVNEALVRMYLKGNPLGQRITPMGSEHDHQIVGVVKDAVYETLRAAPPPTVYLMYLQGRPRPMTLVVDAAGSVVAARSAIRTELQPKVPAKPLRMRTLREQIDGSLIRERLMMTLTTVFGLLALTLAAIGLYGLMSYSVAARTREIGVRIALGAAPGRVLRMVLGSALRMVAAGVVIGVPAAWLLSRFIARLVYGLSPTDSLTTAFAIGVLVVVGIAATAIPARRAASVNPVLSIQAE